LAGAVAGGMIGSAVPVIGTVAGAFAGWIIGSLFADKVTQQEPDYVAAYTKALRTDWDKVAPTVGQAAAQQLKARLNELLKRLGGQVAAMERTPPTRKELRLRRKLQDLLEHALERLGRQAPAARG